MISYLKDWHCVDYEGLLLMKSKELDINSYECTLLLYVLRFTKMNVSITPLLLMEYITFDSNIIDESLTKLIKYEYIINTNGNIQLGNILDKLLTFNIVEKEVESVNLISKFESEFGRALTPMELSMIQEWKESSKFEDDTILLALKEAVKSNALRFRYIETILDNWNKNGITERFANDDEMPSNDIEHSEFEWWK